MLPDIGHILNRRYATATADYLEIRDYKTSGLTGPILQKDLDPNDHGNYFKLVFDTGKEQTNSSAGEAGGSWGYGKSVYYRVGIGLVIFYTQIKEDGVMKSRLIISLIENETDEDAILKEVIRNRYDNPCKYCHGNIFNPKAYERKDVRFRFLFHIANRINNYFSSLKYAIALL